MKKPKYCSRCGQERFWDRRSDGMIEEIGVAGYIVIDYCNTCDNTLDSKTIHYYWWVKVGDNKAYQRSDGYVYYGLVAERYGPYKTWRDAFKKAKTIESPDVVIEQGLENTYNANY